MKKIPLTYNGVQVGECEVEFTDEGVRVKGHVFHPDVAKKLLGPSIENVSFGFDADAIDFSGIQSNDHMISHWKDNTPVKTQEEIDRNARGYNLIVGKENDDNTAR